LWHHRRSFWKGAQVDDTVQEWVAVEFGRAELGDKRRTERLMQVASALGQRPRASLPEAANGDEAALKGMYRFFDNDCVEHQAILDSHIGATNERIQAVDTILAVQDSTEVYWTHGAEGLGTLRGGGGSHEGCLVHSTLAMTPERVPLGLLQQQVWRRLGPPRLGDHTQRPIEDKESRKWLTSLEAVCATREACPTTHFVSVGDREADVYDLFLVPRSAGVDLLVRARTNRLVAHPERKLWDTLASAAVGATVTVQVRSREDRPARTARLTVRWRQVTLFPPKRRAAEKLPRVTVWAILAREESPPKGAEPVEWMLLTTLAIASPEDALRCLEWYACRWGIEVWHKVLKSGCQIEARELQTADRLIRCLAVFSVVAWYVLYATMLARIVPDQPCTLLLDAVQWQALYCVVHETSQLPDKPPTLRDAVRWIAKLGGFMGRKGDGEPGIKSLWQGLQRLFDMAIMYRALRPSLGA
jgi:hypothetical protein